MLIKILVVLLSLSFIFSCSSKNKATLKAANQLTPAEKTLAKAVVSHGGTKYDNAYYSFTFRKRKYTFQNQNGNYIYTLKYQKDGQEIFDKMTNNDFTRKVNGSPVTLTEKQTSSYANSLNSVIYFATLPHKLQDEAVNKAHLGTTTIKGKNYEVLKIYFDEENGGKDHDDVFHYWINAQTHRIDYLACNYQVNGGGVRFRSAYNPRTVGGILFQDYVNYKAPVGTPLVDLPKLMEKNQLEKLSLIETEDVVELSAR
ncbi:MAG: DUF6503 family protein [Bacteroidota bacterium]